MSTKRLVMSDIRNAHLKKITYLPMSWFLALVSRFIVLVLAANFLQGCEIEYPWKLQESEVKNMVVDGIITNEMKAQRINLSITNTKPNKLSEPLSGATVTVDDKNNQYHFIESSTIPGSYFSLPFQAVVGKTYVLTIFNNSKTFTARDSMVSITELSSFNLSIESKGDFYVYNHIKTGMPAIIEVYFDWTKSTEYTQTYGSREAQETFYILKNVDINEVLHPDKEIIRFPKGTKIIRRKYSLSEEHQVFIRSLLMETEWRGGLFDVQQGNVSTNLNNGALGFFGVCMILKDSMVVN